MQETQKHAKHARRKKQTRNNMNHKKLLYDKSSNIMINHDDLDTITTKTKVKEQSVYA